MSPNYPLPTQSAGKTPCPVFLPSYATQATEPLLCARLWTPGQGSGRHRSPVEPHGGHISVKAGTQSVNQGRSHGLRGMSVGRRLELVRGAPSRKEHFCTGGQGLWELRQGGGREGSIGGWGRTLQAEGWGQGGLPRLGGVGDRQQVSKEPRCRVLSAQGGLGLLLCTGREGGVWLLEGPLPVGWMTGWLERGSREPS